MKKTISILAAMLALVLVLSACGQAAIENTDGTVSLSTGGTLLLKVNPEIAISYDQDGNVTDVTARNEDAKKILEGYSFQGKDTKTVVSELVTLIGNAGYFVEEFDGGRRKITLEIEPGSSLPSDVFLEDVVAQVKAVVEQNAWNPPLNVDNLPEFGVTNYNDTPYGITDYNDTDYGPNADGITDYNDTPYGVTDYNDTDYGPNADGVTDYNDTPYGTTDYNDTPYDANTDYGTDYNDSDYGDTDYR